MSRLLSLWKNKQTIGPFLKGNLQLSTSLESRYLVNPITGQNYSTPLQDTTLEQVKEAVEYGRNAQKEWNSLSNSSRREGIIELARKIEDEKYDLAQLEIIQTGKPWKDALGEIEESIECLRFFASYVDKSREGKSIIGYNAHCTTVKEPIGLCGLITSFNYPFMLTSWKLGPSLATGNSVLIKPAPQTPLTSLALADLAKEILPDNLIQVLPGDILIGKTIVDQVDKVSFTGSTPAGQAIMKQASQRLQPLTLECGGKNTAIIDKDVSDDLESIVYHISQGAFSNAGQNCCAISKVLVHESIYNDFIQLLKTEIKKWKPVTQQRSNMPDFTSKDNNDNYYYCPLIDEYQYRRVQSYLTNRPSFQADNISNGSNAQNGYFIPPTVYINVNDDDRLAKEEIFGPILSVLKPFVTIEQAIERVNISNFGLAAGVFSNKYSNAYSIASQLRTGIVWINTYNYIPPFAPFGGRQLSGFGKDLGQEALDEFTFTKTILHELK